MGYVELPHTALWRRTGARPPEDLGVDGSKLAEPVAVMAFFDPLAPRTAEMRYGVVGTDRPYLAMFDPEVMADLTENDVIEWDGMSLTVRQVRRFPDPEMPTLEAVLNARTRGRHG